MIHLFVDNKETIVCFIEWPDTDVIILGVMSVEIKLKNCQTEVFL